MKIPVDHNRGTTTQPTSIIGRGERAGGFNFSLTMTTGFSFSFSFFKVSVSHTP